MPNRALVILFIVAVLLFIIGMFIYWFISTEYISQDGTVTTGSTFGLILIFIGVVLMFLSIFLYPIEE